MEVKGGTTRSRPGAAAPPVFDGENWHTISMVFWADSIGKNGYKCIAMV
ncbi:hypothetical protein [Niabella ginsengisoli]|uniref:Uncharacterized protein n=1 Tax=Niabella ginsengisoli TaxID=522298 RepID=A0ABS9SG13_9BACT|nr:hypothetical protein [Niabella ginsengisoli]MCH5597300.1 hypothetical protein [Niabella ginsengisoli]